MLRRSPATFLRTGALVLLLLLPSLAQAAEESCRVAMRERLNLAIGLYRIELAASHMVGQVAAARNNPGRRQQLATAKDGLSELLTRLKSRANDVLPDATAKGRCSQDTALVTPIHAALIGYFNQVEARWQFMERQLAALQRLKDGQHLPLDASEVDLWIREPLARYEVWRTLAQVADPKGESAAALYVLGMLTRFEWDTATALRDAVKAGGDPRKSLADASADAETLRRSWPRPETTEHAPLWDSLATIVSAMPDTTKSQLPDQPPADGWAAWIGAWIRPFAEVFSRTVPTSLKSLEDLGL